MKRKAAIGAVLVVLVLSLGGAAAARPDDALRASVQLVRAMSEIVLTGRACADEICVRI